MLMPEIDYETKWVKAEIAAQIETELAEAKEALVYIVETDKIMRPDIRHVHAEKVLNGEKFDTAKELASEKARLDWVLRSCDVSRIRTSEYFRDRYYIDAAMKEESK